MTMTVDTRPASESFTPRTDENLHTWTLRGWDIPGPFVEFTRKLEREIRLLRFWLSDLAAENDELKGASTLSVARDAVPNAAPQDSGTAQRARGDASLATEPAVAAVRSRCIRCGADWNNGQLVDPRDDRGEAVRGAWKRIADRHAFAYSPEYLNDGTVDAMMEFAREYYQDAAPQAPFPGVVQNPGGKADLHSASPAVAAPDLIKAAQEVVAAFAGADYDVTRRQNNALGKLAGLVPKIGTE